MCRPCSRQRAERARPSSSGSSSPWSTGRSRRGLPLDGAQPSRAYIGKGPLCQLRLTDPEVSRRHLALDVVDAAAARSPDSGHVTAPRVNGAHDRRRVLDGGERIDIGATTIAVEAADAARRRAAVARRRASGGWSARARRCAASTRSASASRRATCRSSSKARPAPAKRSSPRRCTTRARARRARSWCSTAPRCPPNLVESELFGHERGAFTGAVARARASSSRPHGGTLLIDEIGDLDLALQPKLLRALERSRGPARRRRRLIRRSTCAIIAATRRDLDREVQARPLPRRPLLPARGRAHRAAAAARAARRRRAPRAALLDGARRRRRAARRTSSCSAGRTTRGRATCASSDNASRGSSRSAICRSATTRRRRARASRRPPAGGRDSWIAPRAAPGRSFARPR